MVIHEKGVVADIGYIDSASPPEEWMALNLPSVTAVMIERDLILYEPRIIMEYLDERFPHPPLYPPEPMAKARLKMLQSRIVGEWYSLLGQIESSSGRRNTNIKKLLRGSLLDSIPLFDNAAFFLNEEFTLLDCILAPLLWRLPMLGIVLPSQAKSIKIYAERLFMREAFKASLSKQERHYSSYLN